MVDIVSSSQFILDQPIDDEINQKHLTLEPDSRSEGPILSPSTSTLLTTSPSATDVTPSNCTCIPPATDPVSLATGPWFKPISRRKLHFTLPKPKPKRGITLGDDQSILIAEEEYEWDSRVAEASLPSRCSSKSLPLRHRSHHSSYEWDYSETAPTATVWDCRGMSRVYTQLYSKTRLTNALAGTFIVRDKRSDANHCLTVKMLSTDPDEVATFMIDTCSDSGDVWLRGTPASETFPSIELLVAFYMTESRPSLGLQLQTPAPSRRRPRDPNQDNT
eukprot:m.257848 g.257848  ORF g.257848 m.257848 type:complete len:276 (+) comp35764_c1_seq1:508-1335(+)